jgi:hypothetical protein
MDAGISLVVDSCTTGDEAILVRPDRPGESNGDIEKKSISALRPRSYVQKGDQGRSMGVINQTLRLSAETDEFDFRRNSRSTCCCERTSSTFNQERGV